ncbi:S-ADENOSYL-L-METHIONINE-DEPENDENT METHYLTRANSFERASES SUPERFAMILY PROTEIN [Salix viminalis]|uniref:S-ADENOSYL-L-METHIONINE-DEPENDENT METHYLTRANSFERASES SUPERFAMILY PROTEIN n=1 Tax=Salix viminalis TaxID=40686 RepID=A0A9Q0NIR1_SALVM|nr:S-ADENOSYL-L-METHIONINE-DEPENDENT METHYLTRANSFERASES SUPERFAMILY PROTEIN [Salix viminalis]
MEPDRLNSPSTSAIILEVLGHQLQFSQDPNSKHLGTTVWDASMVLVKFLERNCRRGRFCPSKLKGKRVIELGAGCGVAGFGMALLGCDVVATDQIEVLPLLMRNAERNTARIMQKDSNSDSFGSIQVAELDWGNEDHIRAVDPPFDYIIGTDVVYAEHLLDPLLQTILALSGPKTTILLGYEIRSTNVHERMLDMWKKNFEVKTVPKAKMDCNYQHPSIQLYIMGMKPPAGIIENRISELEQQTDEVEMVDKALKDDENGGSSNTKNRLEDCSREKVHEDCELAMKIPNGKLTDWEARRLGSMTARLLQDVKIT